MVTTTSIERLRLDDALSIVSGAVERSHALPILENVLMRSANGKVAFTASDSGVQVTKVLEGNPADRDYAFTAHAKKFNKIVNSADGKEIKLSIDKGQVKISTGRGRYTLKTLSDSNYPLMSKVVDREVQVAVKQGHLKTALEKVLHASAKNDIRYYLNSVQMILEGNLVTINATDGHRLAQAKFSCNFAGERIVTILPLKTAMLLVKMISDSEEEVFMALSNEQVRFDFSDTEIISKVIEGKYPEIQKIIRNNINDVKIKINRHQMLSALTRCNVLGEIEGFGIEFLVDKNAIFLDGSTKTKGEAEVHEEVDVVYEGEKIQTRFHIKYLSEALSSSKSDEMVFAFDRSNTTNGSLHIYDGSDAWVGIIMPVRY